MNSVLLILFYSLSLAFCWGNVIMPVLKRYLKLGKPFTCTMCMTGWFALILGLIAGFGWECVLVMAAGVFIGGLFEAIKMRWL
ncbi:MAG: hypothetical protein ACTHMC_01325 [Pseudobacter sp.]|uniref:hypothetical protein n=1 Tax=Pseudobacter sp. TaxID=2045420 RepID=UPI003F7E08E3